MPQGRGDWAVLLTVIFSSVAVMAWSWTAWVEVPQRVQSASLTVVGADATGEAFPLHHGQKMMALGEAFTGAQVDTTLLEVRKLAPPSGRTSEGREWLGVRVSVCTHADAEPGSTLAVSDWVAETDDGQRHAGVESPWLDYPVQELPTTPVQLGACHVGWVVMDVPVGTSENIRTVTFAPDGAVWAPSALAQQALLAPGDSVGSEGAL
jgi:hypothetical protein